MALPAYTVNNPLARGLSLRTGGQTMLYLSHKLSDLNFPLHPVLYFFLLFWCLW